MIARAADLEGETAQPAGRPRLAYIDNVRTALIASVVVGHVAITYGGGSSVGQWYYHEAGQLGTGFAVVMTMLMGIGMASFMGLFMLIGGFFTPRPYDRRGFGPFLAGRFLRLGVPLVVYAVVINPLVTYWAARHGGFQGSIGQFIAARHGDLTSAAVGPLWFAEAILIFSVVYAVCRSLLGPRRPAAPDSAGAIEAPRNRAVLLFIAALGLITFVVRIWAPVGWNWEPPHLEIAHFPQYVAMFAAGIAAYRRGWLAGVTAGQARLWRWVALASILAMPALAVAAGALSGDLDPAGAGGLTWLSLAYSLWEAFMCVSMSIAVLTWFRDRCHRRGRVTAELAAATYAVYVLHPLVIVPLTLALSGVRLGLELKFLAVAPIAVLLCFLTGILVRKLPLVNRVL